jgi:hypothetical protein
LPDWPEDQRQFGLLVELQALFVHLPVHVYRQVGQAQQRLFEAQQPCLRTCRRAHHHPPGQAQVAIGKGGQDGPAIDFHPQTAAGRRRPAPRAA